MHCSAGGSITVFGRSRPARTGLRTTAARKATFDVNFDPVTGKALACTRADVNGSTCVNAGGDYLLNRTNSHSRNSRSKFDHSELQRATHDMWANGWVRSGAPAAVSSPPVPGLCGNLGRNTFVGPGQWFADMSPSRTSRSPRESACSSALRL